MNLAHIARRIAIIIAASLTSASLVYAFRGDTAAASFAVFCVTCIFGAFAGAPAKGKA